MGDLPVRHRVRCWVDCSDGCLVLLLGSTREVMDNSVGHVGLLSIHVPRQRSVVAKWPWSRSWKNATSWSPTRDARPDQRECPWPSRAVSTPTAYCSSSDPRAPGRVEWRASEIASGLTAGEKRPGVL